MIIKTFAAAASISILALVGAGYAKSAPPPLGTGSSHINSGGASGSGEAKNIPLPLYQNDPSRVIFEIPWGTMENTEVKPAYDTDGWEELSLG